LIPLGGGKKKSLVGRGQEGREGEKEKENGLDMGLLHSPPATERRGKIGQPTKTKKKKRRNGLLPSF